MVKKQIEIMAYLKITERKKIEKNQQKYFFWKKFDLLK